MPFSFSKRKRPGVAKKKNAKSAFNPIFLNNVYFLFSGSFMSFYIIIRGPAGVGKTTIAKKLAEKLKAVYVSFDKIRKQHGIGLSEKQRIKANEVAIPFALKKLQEGKIVVFDGVFYHCSQLRHLISSLKFLPFVFTLTAPVEDIVKRDSKRKGKAKMGERKVRGFYPVVARFEPGILIKTSGKTTVQVVNEILQSLPDKK